MASAYMPDVVVEIAFDSGYATPAASRTWTDVSAYLEASQRIDIGFGRGDEFGTADANSLKIVLDNKDGRFTPEKAAGAYYPNVKIGRPIRVTSTRVGGAASTRFLGYVDDWAMSSAGANPVAVVTARSQIARLGIDSTFYESLTASWTELTSLFKLDDTALPALDTRGFLFSLGVGSGGLTWRGGLGPDGTETALKISSNTASLGSALSVVKALDADVVFECFFHVDDAALWSGPDVVTMYLRLGDGTAMSLDFQAGGGGGFVGVQGVHGATTLSGSVADDSALHHAAIHHDGSTLTLYLDGVEVDSSAASAFTRVVADVLIQGAGVGTGTIDLSYVAISPDFAGITERALTGPALGAEALASARIGAYADHAGVESTDIDTTTETLTGYSLYGKTMLEAMRAAELSDGGVLYDSAAGALTYNDRESRYLSASAFTLSAASQQIEATVAPKLDRSALANEATVTQTEAEGVLARVRDEDSIDDYGIARQAWEIQGAYDACLQAAAWRVFLNAEPETRIPSLDVDLLALAGADDALVDDLLAATIGTRFTVTGLPTEFADSSLDFFVEGYTESIGLESYLLSLNVSKRESAKWDVWTVEDATFGALTDNPIAW